MQSGDWLGLEGRVCVVTGAAGGIGQALVQGFLDAGALVVAIDRDEAQIRTVADGAEGRVMPLACDITREKDVAGAADAVIARHGRCDVLVNNAGILRPGALADLPLADWESMLRVNLSGSLLCAQHFGRLMLARGEGTLVHISSISASQPQIFSGAYSPGKAAVSMLSRQLAAEWGPEGVRSNVVSPGLVRTPLSEDFYRRDETLKAREAIVPLRRIGTPSDTADAALFLASPRSSYINGQEIVVDGGLSQTLMGHVPRPGY
jgi:NAD(P)-dependent dehydrogenase (short-subunit alcohol dehydrogenase family)